MDCIMTFEEINNHLHSLADVKTAEHSHYFFKTSEGEYGFGDKFLGIRVPVIRKLVKEYKKTPIIVAEKLLHSEFHEIRLFALLLLVFRFSNKNVKFREDLEMDQNEQKEIYNIYLRNTEYINNWDLVDSSAHYIVGAYLEDKDKSILYDFANSELLWERRIAIMSTFFYIKKNDFTDALNISKLLIDDKEDLIHKAVGWMLREIGNRDKEIEVSFLSEYYKKMPRTMLRYAIEKFSKEERKKYLKGEI